MKGYNIVYSILMAVAILAGLFMVFGKLLHLPGLSLAGLLTVVFAFSGLTVTLVFEKEHYKQNEK